jgi:SNF2 family DNA or RNA helicase
MDARALLILAVLSGQGEPVRRALEERRFRYVLMLTATPIQNRLWDLYSLVDLLTVARGHQNPFGSEGMFIRKFIADNRQEARQLKADTREEFRSIVYGYMSRVRRGDAKLYFPERVIQVIAKPIQRLNRLAQISILQALTSSPHALMASSPRWLAMAPCSRNSRRQYVASWLE